MLETILASLQVSLVPYCTCTFSTEVKMKIDFVGHSETIERSMYKRHYTKRATAINIKM